MSKGEDDDDGDDDDEADDEDDDADDEDESGEDIDGKTVLGERSVFVEDDWWYRV